jgi:hypothetical protein
VAGSRDYHAEDEQDDAGDGTGPTPEDR